MPKFESRIIAPCLAAVVLIVWSCTAGMKWADPVDNSELFLRTALFLSTLIAATLACAKIADWSLQSESRWWTLSSKLGASTWADVRRMTLGFGKDDPIRFRNGQASWQRQLFGFAGYLIVLSLTKEALGAVMSGPILPRLLWERPVDREHFEGLATLRFELSANLTAMLALIAALGSIYFTYRQLQAKVRADSRQAWIDKLRNQIAQFIATADSSLFESVGGKERRRWTQKLNCHRLELEMMLNPSERDHRLLSYLAMKLAFYDSGQSKFSMVQDYRNLVREIVGDQDYRQNRELWKILLKAIPDQESQSANSIEREYSDLVGYTIRLSHVVLKREWERVKSTR